MARRAGQAHLHQAKARKSDEFYTQLDDIAHELVHYQQHFRNQVVLCNCDDIAQSNFARYFIDHFDELGLKRLICSCYHAAGQGRAACYEQGHITNITLQGDGDCLSTEGRALLEQADIVVTNPPFSLFRAYLNQLMELHKKFLVIANINAITYKEVFALIARQQIWLGVNMGRGISGFIVPAHYELYGRETRVNELGQRIVASNNCLWLTNLDHQQRHAWLPLTQHYYGYEELYPRYDNCDAINVNRTADIPCDYDGLMGVPITFLHKFNPEQFELVRFRKGDDGRDLKVAGKATYFRILIRRRAAAA